MDLCILSWIEFLAGLENQRRYLKEVFVIKYIMNMWVGYDRKGILRTVLDFQNL